VKDLSHRSGDVYATIEGRDVETGRARIVRGLVSDHTYEETLEVANMTVENDEGQVTVGGRGAALEDVEAREIQIGRDEPPQ
jgi:hypothetical protein